MNSGIYLLVLEKGDNAMNYKEAWEQLKKQINDLQGVHAEAIRTAHSEQDVAKYNARLGMLAVVVGQMMMIEDAVNE